MPPIRASKLVATGALFPTWAAATFGSTSAADTAPHVQHQRLAENMLELEDGGDERGRSGGEREHRDDEEE
jgi:hypothetical protein